MLHCIPKPTPPSDPSCTHIHPCEAFTHSLLLWSAVCQRLLPLKRRWQPLIITQAERRAFLSAEILPHTHTPTSAPQPSTSTHECRETPPGLHWSSSCLTNESECFVLRGCPISMQPGWVSPLSVTIKHRCGFNNLASQKKHKVYTNRHTTQVRDVCECVLHFKQ